MPSGILHGVEALGVALLIVFALLLFGGTLVVSLLVLMAVLHARRARTSWRSARVARWSGVVNVVVGVLVGLASVARSGSIGLGGVDFRVLAAVGAVLMVVVGAFALSRARGVTRGSGDHDDRLATYRMHAKAALGGAAIALLFTSLVLVLAIASE